MAAPTTLPSYFQFTPKTIQDRDWWSQVAKHPRTSLAIAESRKALEKVPKQPVGPLASEFLAARWKNDRGAVDKYWQSTRGVLTALIMNRCIDGGIEAGNDLPLLDWLWHFLTMPTWVVSAHLPKNDLPDTLAPQLDLAATEMAAFLAETLEVLEPWIDAQSQTLKKSIIQEIDRRVIAPFAESKPDWWFNPKADHVNNWAGVCAGSILAACEALARLGQPRPAARARALDTLNLFIRRGFTPAGECDEGIGYWAYGVGYAVVGWSRLTEEEFRTTVDQKRFGEVVDYPRQVHLFDNTFYSGNDASLTGKAPFFACGWLAGATGQPFFIEWMRNNTTADAWGMRNICVAIRALDTMMRLPDGKPEFPAAPRSRYVTDQQAGIFTDGPITIAYAGGNNAEAHNHNDLGHFDVWHGKQCIIPDLGAPAYTTDFFKADKRYTYLAASSRGHCCPIINNVEQRVGKVAQGEVVTLDLEKQILSIDMTSAYPPEAKLARWTRTCRNAGGTYELTDEFCTTEGVTIENVVWSTVKPDVTDTTIKLGPLTLVASNGESIDVQLVNPKDHLLRDFKEGLYRIGLKYKTEQNVPIKVTLTIK